jgi:hypothetical protein
VGAIEALAGDATVLIEVSPAYRSERALAADRRAAREDQALERAQIVVTRLGRDRGSGPEAPKRRERFGRYLAFLLLRKGALWWCEPGLKQVFTSARPSAL